MTHLNSQRSSLLHVHNPFALASSLIHKYRNHGVYMGEGMGNFRYNEKDTPSNVNGDQSMTLLGEGIVISFLLSPFVRQAKYSQLSANGHSRKRKALLADTFLNSRFYLPVKLCVYAFP